MATFKAVIKKENKREDNTWKVFIRFTHNRTIRYIPTTMYVDKKDITSSFKIKNQKILDRCDELIRIYRERVNKLDLELNDIDIDSVVSVLKYKEEEHTDIDFVSFSRTWCETHTEIKGIKNYITAINSFCNFYGRDKILCNEITVKTIKEFELYLSDKKRAQSLYPTSIVRLFNEARDFYNDEDNDIIRIKHNLRKYKPQQQNVAEKRALTAENVREIFELPYSGIKVRSQNSRRDLAKDCFILSFCLMGMNSADLYNATEYDGEFITYNRTKTKDRRNDSAKMVVRVHSFIKPLLEKYRGTDHVFNFSERFSSMSDLNRSINVGLKQIGKEIGIEHLQFYSARHSMATIAVNDLHINKYVVNEMLCHVDEAMKITDLYIKKDYSQINEANYKLIDYVFMHKKETD